MSPGCTVAMPSHLARPLTLLIVRRAATRRRPSACASASLERGVRAARSASAPAPAARSSASKLPGAGEPGCVGFRVSTRSAAAGSQLTALTACELERGRRSRRRARAAWRRTAAAHAALADRRAPSRRALAPLVKTSWPLASARAPAESPSRCSRYCTCCLCVTEVLSTSPSRPAAPSSDLDDVAVRLVEEVGVLRRTGELRWPCAGTPRPAAARCARAPSRRWPDDDALEQRAPGRAPAPARISTACPGTKSRRCSAESRRRRPRRRGTPAAPTQCGSRSGHHADRAAADARAAPAARRP